LEWISFVILALISGAFLAIGGIRQKWMWIMLAGFLFFFLGATWATDGIEFPTNTTEIVPDGAGWDITYGVNTLTPETDGFSAVLSPLIQWGGIVLFVLSIGMFINTFFGNKTAGLS